MNREDKAKASEAILNYAKEREHQGATDEEINGMINASSIVLSLEPNDELRKALRCFRAPTREQLCNIAFKAGMLKAVEIIRPILCETHHVTLYDKCEHAIRKKAEEEDG